MIPFKPNLINTQNSNQQLFPCYAYQIFLLFAEEKLSKIVYFSSASHSFFVSIRIVALYM